MRWLEVRRHSHRVKPGQHLSRAGVALARRVGEGLGPFERVVTSTLLRALETALAMGFAVDQQDQCLAELGDDVAAEIAWDAGFSAFGEALARNRAVARYARAQADFWRALISAVPDGGRALIVTHGGIVEAGAVAALPDADHGTWGPCLGFCEGVRLSFDGTTFGELELLRVRQPES